MGREGHGEGKGGWVEKHQTHARPAWGKHEPAMATVLCGTGVNVGRVERGERGECVCAKQRQARCVERWGER